MHEVLAELAVAGQTLAIYVFLIVGLRRVGHHTMSQLTAIHYLIIALLGSAVETGLYRGSSSLTAGLVSATTLFVANRVLSLLVERLPSLRDFFVSPPVLLVCNGEAIAANLRREHMNEESLMAAIRLRGYAALADVRYAVMEPDGSVGVVPRESEGDQGG